MVDYVFQGVQKKRQWDVTSFLFGRCLQNHPQDPKNSQFEPVDGSEIRRSQVEVGSLSCYLQGLIHPRWLFGISEPPTDPLEKEMMINMSIQELDETLVSQPFAGSK